jgi:hypothetical protein
MLAGAIVTLVLLGQVPPPAAPPGLLRALRTAPAGGPRAAAATAALHGVPYARSPLGEGEGPDPDPRFRLDAFDCMTFVETAVALGSAATLEEARLALDDVRYLAAPALASRAHEVASQWLPSNSRKGWVADVTRALAGDLAHPAEKEFTAEGWRAVARAGRGVAGVPRRALPLGHHALEVVAFSEVPAIADRIPEGAILLVVREDAPDRATRVSHAGLVFIGRGGERWVRHATSTPGVARVIEEPLPRFLARQEKALPRWPLTGLSVLAILDDRPRLARLAARARALSAQAPAPPPAGR